MASTAAPVEPARRSVRKWLLLGGGLVVLAVIGFGVDQQTREREALEAARPSLTSLIMAVCPSQAECGIEVRTTAGPPWRFQMDADATAAGVSALGIWARETGCLDDVDFDRIGQTRALDGMVESANGRSTWTYHPDDGLVVVCA